MYLGRDTYTILINITLRYAGAQLRECLIDGAINI